MLIIGLTGGIGSGKSQASQWFESRGIQIVDADIIAREIVKKNSPTLNKIINKFGNEILDKNGELNRRKLREIVFNKPQALMDLEQITHPDIRERAKQLLAQSTSSYTILVAPLLLEASEAGLANLCHRILVIDSNEQNQITRASQRDGQSVEKIQHIMANQLSRQERLVRAHDVVDNNQDIQHLNAQLAKLHELYLSMAKNFENN